MHLNQHLQRSPHEFPSARLLVHQPVPDMAKLNFTAISTSPGPLGVPPQARRGPQPSCFAVQKLQLAKKNPSGGQEDG